jgi:hypothetical protein
VRLYCFLGAFSGILGGLTIMAAGLGMFWHGALTLAVGLFALWFGLRMTDEDTPAVRTDPREEEYLTRDNTGPYTPEDFPCPPSAPGRRFPEVGPEGSRHYPPDDAAVSFAVVAPHRDAGPDSLRAIGEALRDWRHNEPAVVRIDGLEHLLQGQRPRTSSLHFMIPIPGDQFCDHTEPVALVFVAGWACNERTAAGLLRALEGLPLAMVVDPVFYDFINR